MTIRGVQLGSVVAAMALTAGVVAAQHAPAPAADHATMVKAVGSVKDVMLALTIPTSETVFKAASEPPKDAAEWSHVRNQALALAESANLLLIGDRVPDRDAWVRFSIAQRDAAVVAIKAAESRDGDALSNASDALYETCDNCHKQYMK